MLNFWYAPDLNPRPGDQESHILGYARYNLDNRQAQAISIADTTNAVKVPPNELKYFPVGKN